MSNYSFYISKTSVYKEVDKHTSYAGAKADASLYDKVRMASGDKTMLERWWGDACGLLVTMMTPYVKTVTMPEIDDASDSFTLVASMPSNWDPQVQGALEMGMAEIVTEYLLQQWFLLLGIETQAQAAQQRQTVATTKVSTLIYARIRPTRS